MKSVSLFQKISVLVVDEEYSMKFYSKESEEKLANFEEQFNSANEINIGNKISIYRDEKERDLFQFLLKLNIFFVFLMKILEKRSNEITIMELGCGNGANSQIIAGGIYSVSEVARVKIIYVDVSSELLKEADKRTLKFKK